MIETYGCSGACNIYVIFNFDVLVVDSASSWDSHLICIGING